MANLQEANLDQLPDNRRRKGAVVACRGCRPTPTTGVVVVIDDCLNIE